MPLKVVTRATGLHAVRTEGCRLFSSLWDPVVAGALYATWSYCSKCLGIMCLRLIRGLRLILSIQKKLGRLGEGRPGWRNPGSCLGWAR